MSTPGPRSLGQRLRALFASPSPAWDEIEDALLRADVGPVVAARLVGELRDASGDGDPVERVRDAVVALLDGGGPAAAPPARPRITLVVGVNGAGKTTTIGKLAARAIAEGRNVAIANADTFRAAASEQLEAWATRVGATFLGQARGADPGAVAWDAVAAAIARGIDELIVDTAGRLHTREPLMEELRKVRRVIEKAAGRGPDETLLVLDATAGQNGLAQARAFGEAVEVTGVALTKLDGTAGGGIVLAVRADLGVPIRWIGTGEGVGDLEPFEPRAFAARLVEA